MRANYIRGYNGIKITFRDLKPNMIRVNDCILHAAKTCRFHGLLDGWYSNAEHAIHCAQKASSRRAARACLVHDFAEMITNDVAGPVKSACPDYNTLCDYTQTFVNFHFLGVLLDKVEMKDIDRRMCATEMKYLRKQPDEDLEGIPFENHTFWKLEWKEAYTEMQRMFTQLFPEYRDAL